MFFVKKTGTWYHLNVLFTLNKKNDLGNESYQLSYLLVLTPNENHGTTFCQFVSILIADNILWADIVIRSNLTTLEFVILL